MPTDTTIITPITSGDPANAAEPNDLAVQLQDAIVAALRGTAAGQAHEAPLYENQGSDPANGSIPASHVRFYMKSGLPYVKNSSNQVSGPFALSGPQFRADSSGTQVIATSTNTKLTILTTEILDTNGDYDNVACRFTPDTAGWYLLVGNVGWLSSVADKIYQARVYKNGIAQAGAGMDFTPSLNGAGFYFTVITLLQANGSSDYFEFFVSHIVGANATVSGAYFWGFKIA